MKNLLYCVLRWRIFSQSGRKCFQGHCFFLPSSSGRCSSWHSVGHILSLIVCEQPAASPKYGRKLQWLRSKKDSTAGKMNRENQTMIWWWKYIYIFWWGSDFVWSPRANTPDSCVAVGLLQPLNSNSVSSPVGFGFLKKKGDMIYAVQWVSRTRAAFDS